MSYEIEYHTCAARTVRKQVRANNLGGAIDKARVFAIPLKRITGATIYRKGTNEKRTLTRRELVGSN